MSVSVLVGWSPRLGSIGLTTVELPVPFLFLFLLRLAPPQTIATPSGSKSPLSDASLLQMCTRPFTYPLPHPLAIRPQFLVSLVEGT